MPVRYVLILLLLNAWPMQMSEAQSIDRARSLMQEGRLEEAIQQTDAVAATAAEPGLRADALSLKANILRRLGHPAEALALHRQVLAERKRLFGTQHPETAHSLINIGNCYNDMEQYAAAVANYRQAAAIQSQRLEICHPDRVLSENNLCRALLSVGQTEEALHLSKASLERQRQCAGHTNPMLTTALLNAANACFDSFAPGSLTEAEHLLREALRLQELSDEPSLNTALILQSLGNVYSRQGLSAQAGKYYQEALALATRLPGVPPDVLASLYFSAGNGRINAGDFAGALGFLRRALGLAGASKAIFKAETLNLSAICRRYLGESDAAIALLEEAVNILTPTEHTARKEGLLAGMYLNIGNCYLDQKKPATALYYFEKAQARYPPAKAAGMMRMTSVWSRMGDAYVAAGRAGEALKLYEKALVQLQQGDPAHLRARILVQQARALHHLKRYDAALANYDAAINLLMPPSESTATRFPLETLSALAGQLAVRFDMAEVSPAKASWLELAAAYRSALNLLQQIAAPLSEGENAAILRDRYHDLYAGIVEVYFRIGAHDPAAFQTALHYAEEAKARQLKQALYWNQGGIPETKQREGRQLRERIAALEKQRMLLETKEDLWPERYLQSIDSDLWEAQNAYEAWRKSLPGHASTGPTDPEATWQAIQAALHPKEWLLLYHYGNKNLLVFAISLHQFQTLAIPLHDLPPQRIETLFQKLSTLPDFNSTTRDFAEEAHALFRSLLAPLNLPEGAAITIVPDGPLAYLPFETLLTGLPQQRGFFQNYPYLMRKHAVSYREAALLPDIPQKKPAKKMLAVAPDYAGHSTGLSPLAFNVREAGAVSGIMKKGHTLLAEAATTATFAQMAPQYSILHISAHGVVNNAFPDYSFLAFTHAGHEHADVLYTSELALLPIAADLTVLSACQTAKGPFFRGEGILSMARALTLAGSRSVVASLWNINDEQTAALMQDFYTGLKQGSRKNEALRQAKISIIDQGDHLTAHPYYWAGLVLHGDQEPVEKKLPLWGLCFLLLPGVVAWWYWRRRQP